jgi:methylglyoxal synthase
MKQTSEPRAMGATHEDISAGHTLGTRKRIALIAHDNRKADLLAWARFNRGTLAQHELLATGTTGALVSEELGLPVHRFLSGPLGGDQQVGAAIAEGRIDAVMFFWDPLEPHPHDVDVKALLRVAVVHNVAIACNRATADFVLSSPLMNQEYAPSFTAEPDASDELDQPDESSTTDFRLSA